MTKDQARTPNQIRLAAPDSSQLATDGAATRNDFESYGMPRRLPLAQRSSMARKVALLEGRLFDDQGHLRQGLSDQVASTRLGEINDLRHDLGWLSVDAHHDYVWPADLAS
jgi:hypothetical protein